MQIGVDVDVSRTEVLLHHDLVLLGVAAAHHQVVLRGDEPVELLEPVRLSSHLQAALVRLDVLEGGGRSLGRRRRSEERSVDQLRINTYRDEDIEI